MPSPTPCYLVRRRSQTEERLRRRLGQDPDREGCIIWLIKNYFSPEDVKGIRARLAAHGYEDCFIEGEERHFLVPFEEEEPERGMAKKLVRPGDKVTFVRPGPPRSVLGAAPLPEEEDRISHVGFSPRFLACPEGERSLAETIFGVGAWERVAFVGQCRRGAGPRGRFHSAARVTLWKTSRAYLWLNVPEGKDFKAFARQICQLLHCKKIEALPVSRLLAVYVPPAWDAFQFTAAAMALAVDRRGRVRRREAPTDPAEPWAVLSMEVDRLCEPQGRVPLSDQKGGLYDPALSPGSGPVATRDKAWNAFIPDAYKQIRVREAWAAMRPEEWESLRHRVKVGVIDGAVWDEHRDLRASRIEKLDFCRDGAWNMPLAEHARRNMHGTVCAGLIGARPPKGGVTGFRGVAPGVPILAVRAFGASPRANRDDPDRPPGYWLLFSSEAGRDDSRHDDRRESNVDLGPIAEAVYWAAFQRECDVINMSFETREYTPEKVEGGFDHENPPPPGDEKWGEDGMLAAVLEAAARHGGGKRPDGTRRGCVLVAAAGNVRTIPPGTEMCMPAVHPDVIRVGATGEPRVLATGYVPDPSGNGLRPVNLRFRSKFLDHDRRLALDLAAPGVRLVSTSPPYLLADENGKPRQQFYVCARATSDAAPLVAGAAALLIAINPSLSAADVRRVLRFTALASAPVEIYPLDPEREAAEGFGPFGELDVAAACAAVRR